MKFNLGIALTILLFFFLTSPIDANNDGGKKHDICHGLEKGDGTQIKSGFCSKTFLGQIPSNKHMTSSLITKPRNEEKLKAHKDFTVVVKMKNIETGHFSDPEKDYYTEPQILNKAGIVQGHSHVTIQRLESENNPPNAEKFNFFLGLNDKAKNGELIADVKGGLPAGRYRICSMSSSFTHQPLVMPVAKRGSQDDCIRITVKGNQKRKARSLN
ncbi:17595_t:CDS:1 [Dentiscutata erythropus]|uniref:17595_t:CDS:1 n=1 Tax=Dentiscutata erythropus TaxID=1348616 RepID=A0A9N8VVQ4_9GLOM|nr:17595_t:CDS:1 [Dentiscutata erythropus]